ncbi:MAG: hypothetical protein IAG13_31490 [Deltaproteobacteria bacterium]|nr:hypothetical protein [Nannocystaceae bacterium]
MDLPASIVFALLAGVHAPARAPRGPAPPSELSTDELRHHEVLRIDRDFGMAHWEIALDGWLPRERTGRIAELRLWWVDTGDGDRRKPFSAHLRRYIDFGYDKAEGSALAVRMAGDHKEYLFTVELDGEGAPVVYADITLDDGTRVDRCRCASGRLLARRVLGMPIGIQALRVKCTDARGKPRAGSVPYRELDGGKGYTPE